MDFFFSPTFRICTRGYFGVLNSILMVPGQEEAKKTKKSGVVGGAPDPPRGSAEWRKPFKSAGPCTLAGRLGRALDHLLKRFKTLDRPLPCRHSAPPHPS